jgi:primosomal protein N' (replication factor Y)
MSPQAPGPPPSAARVVRVLPDVAGLDKVFDYAVPPDLEDAVRVGTMVRIDLHGRRVGAWVVEDDVTPPADVALKGLAKVTGWGPTEELVDLAGWAAWRWAGRRRALLRAASPDRAVPRLPPRAPLPSHAPAVLGGPATRLVEEALAAGGVSVLRLPPAQDPFEVVLAVARRGPALVVAPSLAGAADLGARLRRAGLPAAVVPRGWGLARRGATNVVGARGAAWAPAGRLEAVVVLDEHDEVHQDERTPTWNARDVALERARRRGVPALLVSPTPSLEALAAGHLRAPGRADERAGWPVVEVIDRLQDDPRRPGMLSERLTDLVRSDRRVVCVVNRRGRSRLLACHRCGELGRCERCASAVAQDADGTLTCHRCGERRPAVCPACGHTRLRNLRAGVTRLREELEALAGRSVVEVTGDDAAGAVALAGAGLLVGTEAVLHRAGPADAVVFLDFDQELLAPRYRAAEEAMALLVRAARLLGGRAGGGRLVIQTRLVDHEVVQAAHLADPDRVRRAEATRRDLLGYPPARALAEVAGEAAGPFVEALGSVAGPEGAPAVEVLGPSDGRWLVRATDAATLADALAAVERPPGRLRVRVDPMRL